MALESGERLQANIGFIYLFIFLIKSVHYSQKLRK